MGWRRMWQKEKMTTKMMRGGQGIGGADLSSGAEVVSVVGRQRLRREGERPGRWRRSRQHWPGVIDDDEINELSAGRQRGGETPLSLSVVVGVAPLQQRGGVIWAEAAARNALEGCVLTLEVGDVLLQALEEELLAQTPGCGRLRSCRQSCWAWDFCRPPRRKEEGSPPP